MKNSESWIKVKHISLICIAIIILFIIFVSIVANVSDENRLEYKLNEDEFGSYYIVTDIKNTYRDGWFCKDSITIPSTHKGLPVKTIEKVSTTGIKEIIISDNITHILSGAFSKNNSLQTVVLPDSISSIESKVFEGCEKLKSITIPDSVTSIGDNAFSGCSSLTSITIPDSVTSIKDDAFEYCYKLIEVYNKSSLDITAGSSANGYAGYYAKNVYSKEGESKLASVNDFIIFTNGDDKILVEYTGTETSIVIPDGITSINQYAFYYRSSLKSITIPDSVTSIGSYAFNNCSSLKSITIPDSVASIGDNAFSGCKKLSNIIFTDTATWYRTTNISNWENKVDGTQTIVTDSSANATDLKDIYKDYYWYKL